MLIAVEADERGQPRRIMPGQQWVPVDGVQDRWRLDDERWREEPVCRMYFEVVVSSGTRYTLFADLQSGNRYRQR